MKRENKIKSTINDLDTSPLNPFFTCFIFDFLNGHGLALSFEKILTTFKPFFFFVTERILMLFIISNSQTKISSKSLPSSFSYHLFAFFFLCCLHSVFSFVLASTANLTFLAILSPCHAFIISSRQARSSCSSINYLYVFSLVFKNLSLNL